MALRLLIALALALLAAECGDKILETREVRSWQAEGVASCSYSCIRWVCNDSFDWDMDRDRECGLHNTSCSGSQRAMLQFREIETTYETKVKGQPEAGHRKELSIREETLNRLEACR